MNANDLADRLEEFYSGTHIAKAAEVLRQQQAALIAEQEHNEMLEAELKAMREQLNAHQV